MKLNHLKSIQQFNNKDILLLGLGREGFSSLEFLLNNCHPKTICLADQNADFLLDQKVKQCVKKFSNISTNCGKNYLKNLANYDFIIKTAGIPLEKLKIANSKNITSNTEIFLEIIYELKTILDQESPLKKLYYPLLIGITGTKGKSTTTSLIYEVLKNSLDHVLIAGNIGTAVLNILDQVKKDSVIVLELSSHQLASLKMSPDIAVVQAVTSEHLDYFKNTAEYQQAKDSITKYQNINQYLIYNPNLPGTKRYAELSKGLHLHTSLDDQNDVLIYFKSPYLIYRHSNGKEERIIHSKDIKILGSHNLYNIFPAIVIAKLFKIETEKIRTTIKNFQALPHRLEFVREFNQIKFYNDSLSTNPFSTVAAIQAFHKANLILMIGGHERNQSFKELIELIMGNNVKALISFPTTGDRLINELKQYCQKTKQILPIIKSAKSMPEAVTISYLLAQKLSKAVVLLSPASASFGLFKDYRDRGEQFITEVKKLK